jgi:nicotinate-nucleotide adenylyltransferase
MAAFVAAHWPGAGPDGAGGWLLPGGGRLRPVALQRLDISASDVRARWLAGRSLAGLVPAAVERALAPAAGVVRAAWA